MKVLVFCVGLIMTVNMVFSQSDPLKVIVFGAHPDDCDMDAGGTALLFESMGHQVKFVSLTNGDAGHYSLGPEELAKIRKAEAEEAGKRFGVEYTVMDIPDGTLMPTYENRLAVIREIRKWNADIVIAPRPNDYHPDHRYTGVLVQDAAYMVIVPSIAPDTPPLKKNPVFLYSEDRFKKPSPFEPDIAVAIDEVFEKKVYAVAAHKSQYFDWLPWTAGRLEQVPESEEKRLEMLANWRPFTPDERMRNCLRKWYGNKAENIAHAEGFEICEYGRQPNDEQIKVLFPMLGK